ncbi:transporter (CPA2 family) [Jatrophihabitans sp. GAS493]|uniref:cation:proton antiporter n=1 Tax=Jatrophihabitans sp. GAS493 TaxID=1907575 RepID=UPI000BC0F0CA|nr:cation:proton antiporter [Jatrophihabitans sp. GAS493]SOD74229.1 transporter (CPA2 family) [Jatrophihabitans sp. GAS493]
MENLVVVAAIAAVAPLLASAFGRWIAIPLVVFEIVLGILFGPQVLGWVEPGPQIEFLSQFGLAMLFLLAGYEIDFARIRGRPLRQSAIGWLLSLALGVGLGVLLSPTVAAGVLVGICLTSTALGTLLPVLRDSDELSTPFGAAMLAVGAVGEFGPLIAVALFLSGRSPLRAAVILIVFALLIVAALVVTVRFEHARVHRLIEATLHTSGQFAVRLVILILAALVALATSFGLDMLLGAFGAGVLINLLLAGADPQAARVIETKLDAVGFGFLVPIFFVNTGLGFDLDALTEKASTMALVPIFALLFLVVRGIPATLAAPPGSSWYDRGAIVLLGATGLPIIVAVTTIGVDHGDLRTSTAAALVGAGIFSVLLYPLLGLTLRRRFKGPSPADSVPA